MKTECRPWIHTWIYSSQFTKDEVLDNTMYCAQTVDIMYTTQDCDDGGKLLNFIGICTIWIHPHLCICHSIHGTEHH